MATKQQQQQAAAAAESAVVAPPLRRPGPDDGGSSGSHDQQLGHKRPAEGLGTAAATDGAGGKVARVTDLNSALRQNAAASRERKGLRDEQMAIWGVDAQPRDFTTADRKLWTAQERSMFSSQAQMHGVSHASAFMRDYFKNNEGKPLPPPRPPKLGAFALYKAEQVELLGCSAAGYQGTGRNRTNYNKQIGASWAALSEQAKAP
jgi:hypothetical protein